MSFRLEEQYKDKDPALDSRTWSYDLLSDAVNDAEILWKRGASENVCVLDYRPLQVGQFPNYLWIRQRAEPSKWYLQKDGHGTQILIPDWPIKTVMPFRVPASQAWAVVDGHQRDPEPLSNSGESLGDVIDVLWHSMSKENCLLGVEVQLYFEGLAVKGGDVSVYFREESLCAR